MNRREELRANQAREATIRKRRSAVVIAIVVLALGGIIGAVIAGVAQKKSYNEGQITPPNATAEGIIMHSGKSGSPTLVVYHDYRCPVCKQVEDMLAPSIKQLEKSGDITIENRTLNIIDINTKMTSSMDASAAAAAADVVGKYEEYHDVLYKHQPAEETTGFSKEDLRDTFAKEAGITGEDLTKFQSIVDKGLTQEFSQKMAETGAANGHTSTPQYYVNGKLLDTVKLVNNGHPTAESVKKYIESIK